MSWSCMIHLYSNIWFTCHQMSMSNVSLPILGSPKSHTKKIWISTSSWEQNLKKWFVLQSSNVFSLHKRVQTTSSPNRRNDPEAKLPSKISRGASTINMAHTLMIRKQNTEDQINALRPWHLHIFIMGSVLEKLFYFEWSPPWHFKTATLEFMSAWAGQVRVDIQLISWNAFLLLSTSQTDWKQSSDILSDISFDILADISSDTLSDISFDILSDISFDILSDISFWHSFWHIFWHSFWHIFWHSFWHIFWHIFWHSFWHIFCHSFWHIFWHSFWHIFWHSFWHIFWHSFWHIFWHSFWHISWHSFWHIFWHSFWHMFWNSFWHISWHSFWHIFWHSFWHMFWNSFWHISWHSFWHVFWHSFWHSSFWHISQLRSGAPHWTHMIAVEVRHATLASDDRGSWGPARNTGLTGSRLRSGTEHCTHIIAVGRGEGGGGRGRGGGGGGGVGWHKIWQPSPHMWWKTSVDVQRLPVSVAF